MHLSKLTERYSVDGKNVVDVGCGEGEFASALAAKNANVTGIEIDSSKVAHARELHPNGIQFLVGKADNILVEDNSTDLITFMFSMHHVPAQEQGFALEECLRCLKSGGRLHVVEPDIVGPMTTVVKHVEDETEVRTNTQKLLDQLEDKGQFRLIEKTSYDLVRSYRDFDEIVESIVMVDEARASKLPEVRSEMEQTFLEEAEQTEQGNMLSQPCIMHHFEKL